MIKTIFFLLVIGLQSQSFAQESLFSFYIGDAKIDTVLSEDIRKYFVDDDPSIPLRSVAFDLNGDGNKEKFV